MSKRAKELAERFSAFNNEVIAFVENCSDENWRKVCPGEEWPVGVVVRHVAASHYGAIHLAKMMIAGEKLPEITAEYIDQENAKHAQAHTDCTKDEVLGILRKNGPSIIAFLRALNDADLDRKGRLAMAGGDISTRQFIESVILKSAGDHLSSLRSATGA